MNWEKTRRKERVREILIVLLMGIFLAIVIIGDCSSYQNHIWNFIKGNQDITKIVLQIQATIVTLTIAILALLGGRMTDSYMGISIVDYTLNRRPLIFKQKQVIVVSIILVVVNVFLYINAFYNIVVALFIIECILIIISVSEIYALFSGHLKIETEIQEYVLSHIDDSIKPEKKMELLAEYTEEWEKIIIQQSQNEYDKYFNTYVEIFKSLFMAEDNNSRKELQSSCKKISYVLLTAEKASLKTDGLCFLYDIYELIWNIIRVEDHNIYKKGDEFLLFQEVCWDLRYNLEDIPVETLQKRFRIDEFLEDLDRTAFLLLDEATFKKESYLEEWFSFYIGIYLSKKDYELIENSIWRKPLLCLESGMGKIPENKKAEFEAHQAKISFQYARGLICGGMLELLKEGLFFEAFQNSFQIHSIEFAKMVLAVYCFLYYIAKREEADIVTKSLQDVCQNFLEDESVQGSFANFLQRLSNLRALWSEDLGSNLFDMLCTSEFKPKVNRSKTRIMENVVRDFTVGIVLYMSEKYYMPDLMQSVIPKEKIGEYYQGYLNKREPCTINLLVELFCLLGMREPDVENKAKSVLGKFKYYIKKEFKEIEIIQANQNQKEYENQNKGERAKPVLQEKVMDYFSREFSEIISEDAKMSEQWTIHLDRFSYYTYMDFSKAVDDACDNMGSVFVENLCACLTKKKMAGCMIRNDFESEEKYLDYLRNAHVNLVIGSEFALQPKSHKNFQEVDDFVKDKKCIFVGYGKEALLLKENILKIYIHSVNISIYPTTIEDVKKENSVTYDSDANLYIYEMRGDMPAEFTEEELNQFLYDRQKIIDINLIVSIKETEEEVGEIIQRKI